MIPIWEFTRSKMIDFDKIGCHGFDYCMNWVDAHRDELLEDFPEMLVAIHPIKGIVAASEVEVVFLALMNAFSVEERSNLWCVDTSQL